FHALLSQRTGVGDLLLADLAPAGLLGGIVVISSPGMDHSARPKGLAEVGEVLLVRIVRQFRLFFGVEVIEIAKELIEPVIGRQHVIEITEVVFPELSGGIALVLEAGRNGHNSLIHSDRRTGNADFGKASAIDTLACDKR